MGLVGAGLCLALGTGCRPGPGARTAEMGSFRAVGVGSSADPTVRPARLLPETVDETPALGSEAGGGIRAITAGLRVVTSPKGALIAAEDRLPLAPQSTTALPERLGGGFLFVVGPTLWRADRWLAPLKPIFTASSPVQGIIPGLDRVYVRSQNAVIAIDGRSGSVLDLGPWPSSPYVASYAAADGWRAAAVADMRGVVATFDAGATWRTLSLPLEPKQVIASGDSLAIGGFESNRTEAWYELRADGSLSRLGAPPREVKTKLTPTVVTARPPSAGGYTLPGGLVVPYPPHPPPRPTAAPPAPEPEARPATDDKEDFALKTFGKRPLATAIEDGWPLTDGTAVIARDGALGRVRLSDGTLTELVRDAFPLKPARCHPVTLSRPTAVGAFGFVCGEPRGTTVIYAYEPFRGRLAELKRFDKPRVVTSSGNGALAVRGSCAEDAEPTAPPRPEPAKLKEKDDEPSKEKAKDGPRGATDPLKAPPPKPVDTRPDKEDEKKEPRKAVPETVTHPYCVLGHDNTWREIHVRGEIGGERVVVLADGRIVVVSPPQGLGMPARLTILDKGRASTLPVVFPAVAADVARVLRLGLWLDGFEERRPGVVGGWLEAGGVMLGIEIALDGKATPGQLRTEAGAQFVAGRYGLGWTASRRGYETTDGGMTWTTLEMPDPLVPVAKVERRACGPIGCLAHGWLRIGWGDPKRSALPTAPVAYRASSSVTTPTLQLACEPLAPAPPPVPAPKTQAKVPTPPSSPRIRIGGFGGPPVLGTFQGLNELRAFFSQAPPPMHDGERGIDLDVREPVERFQNAIPLARVYGWGPKTGEWDTLGRWQVKWLSHFSGWPEIRASLPTLPPQIVLDMTRSSAAYGGLGGNATFQFAPGDDGGHALVIGKRNGRSDGVVYELEADRAPVEIRRADGEPFVDIEGVVRSAGRWFIATPPSGLAAPTTTIWQVEGAVARELARVPRTLADHHASSTIKTRLARRSDGRAVGLVVDGLPTAEHASGIRWALPVDLESGAIGEPEPLGYADLAGRTLEPCTDDLAGWVMDAPLPSSVRIRVPQGSGSLSGVQTRLRMTSSRVCVERISGNYDGQSPDRAAQLVRAGARPGPMVPHSGEVLVSAQSMQTRYPLRCTTAK